MQTSPAVVDPDVTGPAVVEAYTVAYDREGRPARGIVLGRTEGGSRFLAITPDSVNFLESFVAAEQVGTRGVLSRDGEMTRFNP